MIKTNLSIIAIILFTLNLFAQKSGKTDSLNQIKKDHYFTVIIDPFAGSFQYERKNNER